jgi:hypothetical protein
MSPVRSVLWSESPPEVAKVCERFAKTYDSFANQAAAFACALAALIS